MAGLGGHFFTRTEQETSLKGFSSQGTICFFSVQMHFFTPSFYRPSFTSHHSYQSRSVFKTVWVGLPRPTLLGDSTLLGRIRRGSMRVLLNHVKRPVKPEILEEIWTTWTKKTQ